MAVDWTQLPRELLESIAGKLTIYADYLRFRAVCPSWRSSVLNIPRNLPPQLPWLMLPQVQTNPFHCAFFDLSTRKLHNLDVLEVTSQGTHCCGSSHGWLIVLDESPAVLLLNPLTRARLHLPPLSTFPNVVSFNYSEAGSEYALRDVSGEIYRLSLREMRDSFIKKVVLSSAPLKNKNFIALAILHRFNILVYCKSGDQSWSFVHVARFPWEDVIYYNDLFYTVDKNGAIAVCDLNGASPTVSVIRPPLQLGGGLQYLVNSGDDELLLVTRYVVHVDLQRDDTDPYVSCVFYCYKTVRFEVFRMNWSEPRWERVTSLGDRMLFIGENTSISFLAYDFRGCLGNCIYFTDDCEFYDGIYDCFIGDHDLGIFKLWDGSIEPLPFYQRNPHSRSYWAPIWVTPNPC
ncbi:F-box protein SKIP23-like [Corylus avellana]|uniref:F-box protein SKIP23-like n=1 Tax=Corylus avellana TaxID=13451 RepID=UPI00286A09FA|nr:F-box protein SKIP23-like [Corylus avellana]